MPNTTADYRKQLYAKTKQRASLIEQARSLARSGQHADHKSIVEQLEQLEGLQGARPLLEDRVFLTQLDRLCALAKASTGR